LGCPLLRLGGSHRRVLGKQRLARFRCFKSWNYIRQRPLRSNTNPARHFRAGPCLLPSRILLLSLC
jgi:hypothetical protein